jgi:hypothetical protein
VDVANMYITILENKKPITNSNGFVKNDTTSIVLMNNIIDVHPSQTDFVSGYPMISPTGNTEARLNCTAIMMMDQSTIKGK